MAKMDPVRLNAIHNELRALAGDEGAFILFLVSGEGKPDRDVQIRFVGQDLRLAGLLELAGAYVRARFGAKFDGQMKERPREPD